MFYYLFNFLSELGLPGAGVFKYVSFRGVLAFIIALIVASVIGKRIIHFLQQKQIGETIRDLDLAGQMAKKGTPTMGGIILIISILIPVLLLARLDNVYTILMVTSTIWLGGMGFWDDYIKVFKKDKEGMKGKYKIVGQVGIGIIVALTLYFSDDVMIRENTTTVHHNVEVVEYANKLEKSTKTTIPFVKNHNFDYADLFAWAGDNAQVFGWIFFMIMVILVVTAVSNGANLTDGLDGLSTGVSAIIGVALGILAYLSSHVEFASYLNLMYVPNSEELVIFLCAFVGALIGFLWYNAYPAQVFMGDTGSLMIGGIIAVSAICIHKELLLPILCGVFFVESLSVILQTSYFKYSKKKFGEGRRIFLMAPIHHHFQKKNIPESKIVVRFWIISILLVMSTIITLKIR